MAGQSSAPDSKPLITTAERLIMLMRDGLRLLTEPVVEMETLADGGDDGMLPDRVTSALGIWSWLAALQKSRDHCGGGEGAEPISGYPESQCERDQMEDERFISSHTSNAELRAAMEAHPEGFDVGWRELKDAVAGLDGVLADPNPARAFSEWQQENGDLFDRLTGPDGLYTVPIGGQVLVTSYSRDGHIVHSHLRSKPGGGSHPEGKDSAAGVRVAESKSPMEKVAKEQVTASLSYGPSSIQFAEVEPSSTGEASTMKRFGRHAKTAPPHMLTAVLFELVRLNERTNDGRLIQDPGFGVRDLPLSFSSMLTTGHGHGEARIIGSIDEVTVEDDGRVWGLGWLLDDSQARLTGKMIQAGALTGNSIELSVKAVKVDFDMDAMKMLVDFTEADLSATTCVGTPAMAGCTVSLVDPEFDFASELTDEAAAAFANEVESFVAGNVTVGALPAFASNFSVIEADHADAPPVAIPESAPPALWFVDPMLSEPTPVRVEPADERGLHRVFGHVADWTHPHLSVPGVELFAPRSRTNYAYFANREVLCADGTFAATGVLTHGGPHAAAELDWRAATAHYDNTCHAWADVSVGEDEHGIWIAGYVRPGTDENTVIAARASGLSGDWRRIRGNLEMVGALSVNAAAFPQRRPSGFAEAGIQTSLVSAGFVGLPATPGTVFNSALTLPTVSSSTTNGLHVWSGSGTPSDPIRSPFADDLSYVASKLRAEELADIADDLTADEQGELDAILEGMA